MSVTPQKLTGDLAQTQIILPGGGSAAVVIGLMDWSISHKTKTVDATTTGDAGDESSLASTRSWTAKAKYAYIDGDPSQLSDVLNALTNQAGASNWTFYPTVATGRAAFQGYAWIDGIDLSAGVGKLVGLDVSLKSTGPLKAVVQTAPTGSVGTVPAPSAETDQGV